MHTDAAGAWCMTRCMPMGMLTCMPMCMPHVCQCGWLDPASHRSASALMPNPNPNPNPNPDPNLDPDPSPTLTLTLTHSSASTLMPAEISSICEACRRDVSCSGRN